MPRTTVVQPEHTSNQRYTTQMAREGRSTTVCRHPPTRIHPLPHSLAEEVSRLPRQAASLPLPTRLPCLVQYPPQISPLRHTQIMARRAKMRELTTLVRELNDTLEDAGPSDGIDWENVTIVHPGPLFFPLYSLSLALRTMRFLSYLLHALPSPLLYYIRVHQYLLMCTFCAPFMPVFPHCYLMYHCTFCARFPTP